MCPSTQGLRAADTNADGLISRSELKKLFIELQNASNKNPGELRLLGTDDIDAGEG